MAIQDCFKKLGKSLNDKDKSAIEKLIADGMGEQEAVDQYLKTLEANRLEGAPEKLRSGDGFFEVGDFAPAIEAAKSYMERSGIEYTPAKLYARIDVERSERIAKEFDLMEHNPHDPVVKAAYRAMIDEVAAQYEAAINAGLKVDPAGEVDPYPKGPVQAIEDVRENNHLYFFKTSDGFGSDDTFDPVDNPLLEETKYELPNGEKLLANDLFRIVHDYFGHIKHGVTFRGVGEENAWQAHAAMFSPLARRAMTTETRGQNSWLNYGPHGETNRTAKVEDTVFADQKIGLLPLWVSEEARLSANERSERFEQLRAENNTGFEGAIDDKGNVELVLYTDRSDGRSEDGTIFGVEQANENGYRQEAGVGRNRFTASIQGELIYDVTHQTAELWDDNDIDTSIEVLKENGYVGYLFDSGQHGKTVAMFDPLDLTPADQAPTNPIQTLNQAQKNGLGLYSAVEKSVLEMKSPQWDKGKDMNGIELFAKIKKTSGIKKEELELLDLENYLSLKKNYSRDEVAQYIRDNGVNLVEVSSEGVKTSDMFNLDFYSENGESQDFDLETHVETGYIEGYWKTYNDKREFTDEGITWYWSQDSEYEWMKTHLPEVIDHYKDRFTQENLDHIESIENSGLSVSGVETETINYIEEVVGDLYDMGTAMLPQMKGAFEAVFKEELEQEYYDDPIEVFYGFPESNEAFDKNSDPHIQVRGNNQGWDVLDGLSQEVLASGISSRDEARVQSVAFGEQRNIIVTPEEAKNAPKHEQFVSDLQPHENYRELKLTLPDVKDSFYKEAHFAERNVLAFLRVTDRKLKPNPAPKITQKKDGSWSVEGVGFSYATEDIAKEVSLDPPSAKDFQKTNGDNHYFVDEFQSDWHQTISEFGVKTGMDHEGKLDLQKQADDVYTDLDFKMREQFALYRKQLTKGSAVDKETFMEILMRTSVGITKAEKIQDKLSYSATFGVNHVKGVQRWLATTDVIAEHGDGFKKIFELESLFEAEQKGAPAAPFGNDAWVALGMKRALVDAIENGHDNFSWADSEMLAERWSPNYLDLYVNHYDRRIVKTVKKLTGLKPERFEFETGKPEYKGISKGEAGKALEDSIDAIRAAKRKRTKLEIKLEDNHILEKADRLTEEQLESVKAEIAEMDKAITELTDQKSIAHSVYNETPAKDGAGYWTIPITPELKAKVLGEGFSVFQESQDGARGSLSIMPDQSRVLQLTYKSDESTTPHELGHLFLEVEKQLESEFGRTEDQVALLKWLGVSSFNDLTTEEHEKFAESFELYLQDGRAPSPSLRKTFSRFRTWITSVYSGFKQDPRFRAELSEESRYVFDRMLATEQEIAEMEGTPAFTPLFRSKEQAGMTDEEFAVYMESPSKVKTRAQQTLDKKIMAALRKRKSDDWAEEKKYIVEDEIARLKETRPYLVLDTLKTNPLQLDQLREELGLPAPLRGNDRFIPKKTDSLLVVAAKKGGLNMDEWMKHGIDEGVLKDKKTNNKIVTKPTFRRNTGMTPQDLVDLAQAEGFGEAITIENVVDMVTAEIGGQEVISEEGQALIEERNRVMAEEGTSDKKLDHVAKFVKKHGRQNGADPQLVSEVFGYKSVEAMINEAAFVPPVKKLAEQNAEAIMVAQYGDILNDDTIEKETRVAMQNEEQAHLLLAEIKALGRKAGTPDRINRVELKAKATELVGTMKYSEIKPDRFYRAAMKAAKRAGELGEQLEGLKAKSSEEFATELSEEDQSKQGQEKVTAEEALIQAKIQQLTNHYLYKESLSAQEKIERQVKYVKKMQTKTWRKNEVGGDYRRIITLTANMYDAKKPKAGEESRSMEDVTAILYWYNTQVQNNAAQYANILDHNLVKVLVAQAEAVEKGEVFKPEGYKFPMLSDLTADEMQSFYEQLRHFRFIGGKEAQGRSGIEALEREVFKDSIIANGKEDKADFKGIPTEYTNLKRVASNFYYRQQSLLNLVRKLDNEWDGKGDGVAYNKIYRDVEDSHNTKVELHAEIYEKMKTDLKDIYKLHLDKKTKMYPLESGESIPLGSEHRFMLGMYWGTESSRQAIMDGYGMTETDVMNILKTMSVEELNTLNRMWKINEHFWEPLVETTIRHEGVAPAKLEAIPFEINGVQLTGGHQKLVYDSSELELKKEQEKAASSSNVMPSKAGSMHARIGSGGRPVMLQLSNITQAIDETVHYIAFADSGARLRALVNAKDVREAIQKKHGDGFHKALIETIDGVTGTPQSTAENKGVVKAIAYLRKAAVARHLMYSVRNTAQQITAVPIVMQEVGTKAYLSSAQSFYTRQGHDEIKQFVNSKSAFMAERASFVNREAAENMKKLGFENTKLKKMWQFYLDNGFAPQTFIDSMVAYPAWMAKYEQAIAEHGDVKKAVSQADTSVAESVGSGTDLHLGGSFQSNNSEFMKGFTMFGSWFNAYFQRMVRDTENFSTAASKDAIYTLVTTPMIVGVMSAFIISDYPDEDGDDENWWLWIAKQYGKFMGGTFIFLRDFVSYGTSGFAPTGVHTGMVEATGTLYNVAEDLLDPDSDRTAYKNISDIIKVGATVLPIPASGNATRILDYLDSEYKGDEGTDLRPWQALVEGKNKN